MSKPTGESFRELLRKRFDVITYRGTWSMFRETYRLFDQATFCFDAKAYDAVCIMCRATIEAACYVFLTRKKGFGTLIQPPRTLDNRVRQVGFFELQNAVRNILSEDQRKALNRIKKRGDFIAHIVESSDRLEWLSLEKNPGVNPYKSIPEIGEREAEESLNEVISIFPTLAIEAAKDIPERTASILSNLSEEKFTEMQRESDPKNWQE